MQTILRNGRFSRKSYVWYVKIINSVEFRVKADLDIGYILYVCGKGEALGNWDVTKGVELFLLPGK